LTLPESTRYIKSQEREGEDEIDKLKKQQAASEKTSTTEEAIEVNGKSTSSSDEDIDINNPNVDPEVVVKKQAHFKGTHRMKVVSQILIQLAEFIAYFSEWKHAKLLIGTCMCWFLLDIA